MKEMAIRNNCAKIASLLIAPLKFPHSPLKRDLMPLLQSLASEHSSPVSLMHAYKK